MSGDGIDVYPFHGRYPDLPDLFHVACPRCPDFGFCGERDRADVMAAEHAKTCKEGQG